MNNFKVEAIGPYSDSKDNERLFYTIINRPGITVEFCFGKRYTTVTYKDRGKVIAVRNDALKRGKIVDQQLYIPRGI